MSHALNREAVAAAREDYERWLRSNTAAFSRRTAEKNAAFFLPHLRPGMSLLDAGCGPGSITLGLAAAVSPGTVLGVDVNAESLAIATNLATERGVTNVTFEAHHIRVLPYPDESFDAVFMHAVLQHLDEPDRALAELFRVMKPGGVIGVADADFDGALFWPEKDLIDRGHDLLSKIRLSGDTRVGRRLRGLLVGTGFERVVGMVAAGADGEPNVIRWNGAAEAKRYSEEPFVAYAEALGLATRAELAEISAAWLRWSEHPGAFAARFWCQAIGFKPA